MPDFPNGEICKYFVILKNVDQGKMMRIMEIEERLVVMSNLTSYTEYQVSVSACSNSSHGIFELCSEYWAGKNFTTLVVNPAKANTPLVRLVNSTTVDVEWNSDFQVRKLLNYSKFIIQRYCYSSKPCRACMVPPCWVR